jgi:hypothetical protein
VSATSLRASGKSSVLLDEMKYHLVSNWYLDSLLKIREIRSCQREVCEFCSKVSRTSIKHHASAAAARVPEACQRDRTTASILSAHHSHFHLLQDGIANGTSIVKQQALLALLRLLGSDPSSSSSSSSSASSSSSSSAAAAAVAADGSGPAAARALFRTHGLGAQLATLTTRDITVQGKFDEDLAFAFVTLLSVLLRDGLRRNLDVLTGPVIRMLLLAIAHGHAALMQSDSTTAHIVPRAKVAAVDPKASARADRAASLLGFGPAAPVVASSASSSAGGSGGVVHSSSGEAASLRQQFQAFFRPSAVSAAAVNSGSGGGSGGGSGHAAAAHSRIPLPRDIRGTVSPCDAALYVLHRATSITDEAEEAALAAAAASGSGNAGAVGQADISSEKALAAHAAMARDEIRTACSSAGLAILCVLATDCARTVAEMTHLPAPPLPSAAFLASLPDAATAAAIGSGVPARHVQTVFRLRLLLQVMEDSIFLAQSNISVVASGTVATAILKNTASSSSSSASSSASSPSEHERELPQRLTVVCVLLNVVEWCVQHLHRIGLVPSNSNVAISSVAVGTKRALGDAGDRTSTGPSASKAASQEHPLLDVMQGCLRVLINLSNNHRPGCRAVMDSWQFPFRSQSNSQSQSQSQSHSERDEGDDAEDEDDPQAWGIAVIAGVISAFASSSNAHASSSAEHGPSKRRKVGDESSPHQAPGHGQQPQKLGLSHFDALVHACGLLANCVEHEPRARHTLAHTWLRSGPSALGVSRSEAAALLSASAPLPGGAKGSERMPALAFLCWLFVGRWNKLDLKVVDNDASKQKMVDVDGDAKEADAEDEAEGEEEGRDFEADDLVVAAYLALLLGCAMREEHVAETVILASLRAIISEPSGGSADDAYCLAVMSTVLRAFIALQTHAGVLTEEALGHVETVQAIFDHIKHRNNSGADSTASSASRARMTTAPGGPAAATKPAEAADPSATGWSWASAAAAWRSSHDSNPAPAKPATTMAPVPRADVVFGRTWAAQPAPAVAAAAPRSAAPSGTASRAASASVSATASPKRNTSTSATNAIMGSPLRSAVASVAAKRMADEAGSGDEGEGDGGSGSESGSDASLSADRLSTRSPARLPASSKVTPKNSPLRPAGRTSALASAVSSPLRSPTRSAASGSAAAGPAASASASASAASSALPSPEANKRPAARPVPATLSMRLAEPESAPTSTTSTPSRAGLFSSNVSVASLSPDPRARTISRVSAATSASGSATTSSSSNTGSNGSSASLTSPAQLKVVRSAHVASSGSPASQGLGASPSRLSSLLGSPNSPSSALGALAARLARPAKPEVLAVNRGPASWAARRAANEADDDDGEDDYDGDEGEGEGEEGGAVSAASLASSAAVQRALGSSASANLGLNKATTGRRVYGSAKPAARPSSFASGGDFSFDD